MENSINTDIVHKDSGGLKYAISYTKIFWGNAKNEVFEIINDRH
jgi:hypothetical protein